MSWFGSDLVAVGCILGSAAAGGAATFALLDGPAHTEPGCAVEAMAVSPRIAISHGDQAHTVVVAPRVRVRGVRDCVSEMNKSVEIHLDGQLEHLDAQLEHLDRNLELQMKKLEGQLETQLGRQFEAQAQLEAQAQIREAMRQLERARVRIVVEKGEGGGI